MLRRSSTAASKNIGWSKTSWSRPTSTSGGTGAASNLVMRYRARATVSMSSDYLPPDQPKKWRQLRRFPERAGTRTHSDASYASPPMVEMQIQRANLDPTANNDRPALTAEAMELRTDCLADSSPASRTRSNDRTQSPRYSYHSISRQRETLSSAASFAGRIHVAST